MYKFINKSRIQTLIHLFIASLLILTPLLSSSLRPTYLYFIINLLIISLGADSGLLSNPNPNPNSDSNNIHNATVEKKDIIYATTNQEKKPDKLEAKCGSENVVTDMVNNKFPSTTPSIFFIGGSEAGQTPGPAIREENYTEDDEDEEEDDDIGRQELFNKAEDFIGDFYKQLKMQREDSWKNIHGIYHKAL